MKYNRLNFYKDKVAINLLARDLENAIDIMEVLEGNGLVGLLSKDYDTATECVIAVKAYLKHMPNVSVGLGGGDPKQWAMAAEVASLTNPGHVNQTFTGAMYTEGLLKGRGCFDTVTNCMMYPTGVAGYVQISTGPVSDVNKKCIVDVETAVCMMKDLELPSIKFFNMQGLCHIEELEVLAKACVEHGIPIIEPTGGIDTDNVAQIVKVCVDAGVERVIPHIYSSIIDKDTKITNLKLVKQAYDNIKAILS